MTKQERIKTETGLERMKFVTVSSIIREIHALTTWQEIMMLISTHREVDPTFINESPTVIADIILDIMNGSC